MTGKAYWKDQATLYTANVKENQNNNQTHDVGFIIFSSFGRGYQLTKNPDYLDVILKTSNTLSTRYSNITKVIKSWQSCDNNDYKVIIDNMMNLELLWWSHQNQHLQSKIQPTTIDWYQIANNHALTTSKNHFRKDHSTFHVVNYNQKRSGLIIYKGTHQGNDYSSTWSRGQAWAIYGYVLSYKYSKNENYFTTFKQAYELYQQKIKKDLVPNWDLDALDIKYKDTSAAAIIACGLIEIAVLKKEVTYFNQAVDTLTALLTNYISPADDDKFDAILLHGTSNFPSNLYDQGLIYGDYYFIKAVNLYHQYKTFNFNH
ncbi:unnamed protein product [Cunninghamella blakesleeana]